MNYSQADTQLQGRCRQSRKIGNNTYLIRHDDHISIRLHATEIIDLYPDGRVELDTGGWETVTTKARLNEHIPKCGTLPCGIFSERGAWFFIIHEENMFLPSWVATRLYQFESGFTYNANTGEVDAPLYERKRPYKFKVV